MDGLLSEISTSRHVKDTRTSAESSGISIEKDDIKDDYKSLSDITSALRAQPSLKTLRATLCCVDESEDLAQSARRPSNVTTPFLAVLVNDVLPNYWSQIAEDDDELCAVVATILRSVPGIGALVARLRILTTESQTGLAAAKSAFLSENITCLVQILEKTLSEQDALVDLWLLLDDLGNATQKNILKSELVSLLATGKVISTVSQAQDAVKVKSGPPAVGWLGNGKEYCTWFGETCARLALKLITSAMDLDKNYAQLIARALSIGYAEDFVGSFVNTFVKQDSQSLNGLTEVIASLRPHEQRAFFTTLLRRMDNHVDGIASTNKGQETRVSTLAALLHLLVVDNENLADALLNILTRPESNSWIASLDFRKAAILALSKDHTVLEMILDRASERFADDLFTAHAPVIHQELITQTLLIATGLAQKLRPARVKQYAKSARHMSAISLHLKSNSPRIRWLGMLVGSAVSSLTDDKAARLKFDDESLTTIEARSYLDLTHIDPRVPSEVDLGLLRASSGDMRKPSRHYTKEALQLRPKTKPTRQKMETKPSSALKIVELPDDEDLVPYAKPDSDPEDEEDDPTLVNRDKPKPPVYIRDLLVGLRETEDYDKHQIALTTASSLIRRKSSFGTEVKDHIQELGSVLMNLNNSFEFEDFIELREEALIAVLIADPVPVAQYYAKCAFEGDFSIQQRTSLLAAMGLGARELAAFRDDERKAAPQFPSKELPEHLKSVYGDQSSKLSRVAVQAQRSVTEPLALKAADAVTGPNALKIRTFSSRIAKEKTRKRPAANELAKIVGEGFFFPLTARWWMHARKSGRNASAFASPILLTVYIRTLAIIIHAAGSWALALPQMTAEFWSILLAIRGAALGAKEYQLLIALLFAIAVLQDVNSEDSEGIARQRSSELLETQEWCKLVLEQIPGGDDESDEIRSLAASVIIRCQEVIERWQRLMVGNMIDL